MDQLLHPCRVQSISTIFVETVPNRVVGTRGISRCGSSIQYVLNVPSIRRLRLTTLVHHKQVLNALLPLLHILCVVVVLKEDEFAAFRHPFATDWSHDWRACWRDTRHVLILLEVVRLVLFVLLGEQLEL